MGWISSHRRIQHAHRGDDRAPSLRRRGDGYVSNASPPRELLAAVATVLRGEQAMSADIARAIAQDEVAGGRTALDDLSLRELEILSLTVGGLTAQAVAEALCLSLKTVHNNLSVIRATLGARTDAHLVWIAIGARLVYNLRGTTAEGALSVVRFDDLLTRSRQAGNHPERLFSFRPWLCQKPDGGSFPLYDRRAAWDGSLSVPSAIRRRCFRLS